ncbi:MAG: GNAT family N-acetyltransferase [Allosphingosinicella sp.]
MTISVRPAEPADSDRIRRIHLSAFPSALEADLVERLDSDGDLVISLLAERGGEAIGHIALSRMRVSADGLPVRALGLGPIAVERPMQCGGAGSALIEAAKAIAQATGEALIFVLGEPDYYRRFGFSAATAAPFRSPYSGPYFMALALRPADLPASEGKAAYATAFGSLAETR